MFMQTTRWQDSVQESTRETPQIVTQDCGVGSFARPPSLRRSLSEAQTRSHTNEGSAPSSSLLLFGPELLFFPLLVAPRRRTTGAQTAAAMAHGDGTPISRSNLRAQARRSNPRPRNL